MKRMDGQGRSISRRAFLSGAGVLMAGGVFARGTSLASAPAPTAGTAPPLPWKWPGIDPLEAGSLAYRYYFDIGS